MFFISFIPFLIFAESGDIEIPNPLQYDTLEELVQAIITFIRNVALIIAPVIFIYSGFQYYMAAGEPNKAQEAANTIKWAIIGLAIILIAEGIAYVIIDVMGGGDNGGGNS